MRQNWFSVLLVGILLFLGAGQALRLTGNPNFFPTVLLVGSFIVPVSFVTYIYQREQRLDVHPGSPLLPAALSFIVGGTIGVIVAGVVEFGTLRNMTAAALVGVGLIEEVAKLIFPFFLFLRGRFRSEMDGILFGVASGMGFASLETMGYGLVSFVRSSGDINVLEQVLLVRGLLSPVGHAAWTGIICAVLWRQRQRRGKVLSGLAVFSAFIIAVVLHIVWNLSNFLPDSSAGGLFLSLLGNTGVAAVSLVLLIRRLRESRPNKERPAAA